MTLTRLPRVTSAGRLPAPAPIAGLVIALTLASSAGASNASLRVTLDSWSRKIGADAHSVALAAQRHHPRRMTYSALRFRRDALQARNAIAAQRPSTAQGRRARQLALTAYADYVAAGGRWAASGRARLGGQKLSAQRYARAAATFARAGNQLLVSAGTLLR